MIVFEWWDIANFNIVVPFFFFFQAEDGIRDHCVTGVQTCALPIFTFVIKTPWQLDFSDFYFAARTGLTHGWAEMYNTSLSMPALYAATGNWFPFQHTPLFAWLLAPLSRSEERREGKREEPDRCRLW